MRESQVAKARIVAVLQETGVPVAEVVWNRGISRTTYFNWIPEYGGSSVPELRRMKVLKHGNTSLKRKYAELASENTAIMDVLSRQL